MADIKSDNRIIGILAHVDSGKTTLAEALLYQAGALRSQGRVDHGNAFLDTLEMERQRGITIYSKIARMKLGQAKATLLDTPGHTDFSPEMERTLSVLDYCILVINGADGVTSQTIKLWNLLDYYEVPVFLFVNKMDQVAADRRKLYEALQAQLSDRIQDFSRADLLVSEDMAALSEELLEEYLAKGSLDEESVRFSIFNREIFPCYFGSALKDLGIADFYDGLARWTMDLLYPEQFSARVYKISRDDQGRRLTQLKITGGTLQNRTVFGQDKINEIRLYSGAGYQTVQDARAGELCSVVGLKETRAGQGLGGDEMEFAPTISPVISYRVILEEGGDPARLLALLKQIEEELPELEVTYQEETSQIFVHIMGDVLLEVLADLVEKRGGMKIGVDEGSIIYRETVLKPVVGIGHYEPLRHYAEVQLLLEPGEAAMEIETASVCDQNTLALNWQNLIMTHVLEKDHKGVLMGLPLAKVRITLLAGRAHIKHTSGGDFREATYRAIRQGLMEARAQGVCAILEPWYDFEFRTSPETSGRILTDLSRLSAREVSTDQMGTSTVIRGRGPVAAMRSYARELVAITHGEGQIRLEAGGYEICHNPEEIIQKAGYDALADTVNPSGSIFTAQGAGIYVPWHEVQRAAHIPPLMLTGKAARSEDIVLISNQPGSFIDAAEVDRIINSASHANANEKKKWRGRSRRKVESRHPRGTPLADPGRPTYLLVDGYNVIYAWPELKALQEVNFDAAREKLLDILQDYQGYSGENILLVFDAYKVARGAGSQDTQAGLSVIYTRENETADRYIERRAMELAKTFQVKVVTSDAAEQLSALGSGALVYSARRFREMVAAVTSEGRKDYERSKGPEQRHRPFSDLLDNRLAVPADDTPEPDDSDKNEINNRNK